MLFTVPVPHPFTLRLAGGGSATIDAPKGSQVTGTFTISNERSLFSLSVECGDGELLLQGNTGSFAITVLDPPCQFTALGANVTVSGSASYPILP